MGNHSLGLVDHKTSRNISTMATCIELSKTNMHISQNVMIHIFGIIIIIIIIIILPIKQQEIWSRVSLVLCNLCQLLKILCNSREQEYTQAHNWYGHTQNGNRRFHIMCVLYERCSHYAPLTRIDRCISPVAGNTLKEERIEMLSKQKMNAGFMEQSPE